VGLYLSQLPPAELARLKAELAETLIENFCFPRFLDYRTSTLRMRPVDRSKRQEVWSFLSSYDFGAWGRVDIQSPEFQRLVERLLIQFIQRNRAFFGNQGRKRMSDVRALIGGSSTLVTEGLRSHLSGQATHVARPFGGPRPALSWAGSTIAADLHWEQIAGVTQLLQQQLQELRGEIQAEGENGAHAFPSQAARATEMPPLPPRRSPRNRAISNGSGTVQAVTRPAPPVSPIHPADFTRSAPQAERPAANASPGTRATHPLDAPAAHGPQQVPSMRQPAPSTPVVDPTRGTGGHSTRVEEVETVPFSGTQPPVDVAGQVSFSQPPARLAQPPAPMRELSRTPSTSLAGTSGAPGALARVADSSTMVVSDEDIVIFEQVKYQLIVWLRVEAVRLGLDIADQSPQQLVELLRHQDDFDENRLQVVTTLLHLADSVSARGQAALIDYKQALMFYLMHTRRAR
jgi:hypothetical protein